MHKSGRSILAEDVSARALDVVKVAGARATDSSRVDFFLLKTPL
jgi:hypothetical protein